MPLIRLIDGISVDEYVEDHSTIGYMEEGECVIEHGSLGTVGLKYDPVTSTFNDIVATPVDLINLLTTDELIELDGIKNTDAVRYKLLNDILSTDHSIDDAYAKFKYVSDAGIMDMSRIVEIIIGTKYQEVIPLLLNEAPTLIEADSIQDPEIPEDLETEPEIAPT